MKLDDLLAQNGEASAFFDALPEQVQRTLRRTDGEIDSLDMLRDRMSHVLDRDGPFYAKAGEDGTMLDPGMKAAWTREHQT